MAVVGTPEQRDDQAAFFAGLRARSCALSPEDELCLARRIERGDLDAKNTLVEAHLSLVVAVARRYRNQGLPATDLVQEGCIGLIRATEKFDCRRGHRFATYATWWIRQAMSRALADKARTIRLPVPVVEKQRRIGRAEAALAAGLGRAPSAQDIGPLVGLSAADVEAVRLATRVVASLDRPSGGGEDDRPRADSFVDSQTEAAFRLVEEDVSRPSVLELLLELPALERRVIELRFGLDGDDPQPRRAVACALGLTAAQARRIEAAAIAKMRAAIEASARTRRATSMGRRGIAMDVRAVV